MSKKVIQVRFPKQLAERIKLAAEADDRPAGAFVCRLTELALDAVELGELKPNDDWTTHYRAVLARNKETADGDKSGRGSGRLQGGQAGDDPDAGEV